MTMNENTLKGKWLEIKGDMKSIQGLIQQKYGKAQENYEGKLSDIFKRFEDKKNETTKDIKLALKK